MRPTETEELIVAVSDLIRIGRYKQVISILEAEIEALSPPNEDMLFIVEAYNITGLPQVTKLTQPRRAAMRQRWKEHPNTEWWIAYFARVRRSPFLMGQKVVGWKATFDWLLKPANLQKVIEGNYDPPAARAQLDANDETAYRMSGVGG